MCWSSGENIATNKWEKPKMLKGFDRKWRTENAVPVWQPLFRNLVYPQRSTLTSVGRGIFQTSRVRVHETQRKKGNLQNLLVFAAIVLSESKRAGLTSMHKQSERT